ncbi:guanine nucleotide binding protein, alpha subunit [Pisolithus sp. B1]|nr:guanine nucleotide binding protein, alpha subunit [Pisolithus sp. B1]
MIPSLGPDPLASLLAPPANENPQQKAARERAEAEARKVSEAIDEQIRQEKIAMKKRGPVKVLLLGQSESGMKVIYDKDFATHETSGMAERLSWRTVVYLNLVRNIVEVLDILVQAMEAKGNGRRSTSSADAADSDRERRSQSSNNSNKFSDKYSLLKLRLAPLRSVLTDLEDALDLARWKFPSPSSPTSERRMPERDGPSSPKMPREDHDEVTDILLACKDDMKNLWEDSLVQELLSQRKVRIEDSSGFFLNDIDRIVSRDYEPSDDDVVRARLRSVGVQEYKFTVAADQGKEWIMYDLEGTRSMRASWAPFFDDVNAIIFLAPISCFDEQLREDRNVNRLEDSLQLWRTVCSSRILAKTQIILFLNKCDILRNKLQRGVQVKAHVPSFGDRKNDAATAMKYFQHHFKEIFKASSPEQRSLYAYFTSVVDTQATSATLTMVQDSVLRQNLHTARLV